MKMTIKRKNNIYEILIDDEDYEKISKFKWFINKRLYVRRTQYINGKEKELRLHRYILNIIDSNIIVDHINGNTLDNRKCNLRICNNKQNSYNSKKIKSSSKYKGVFWNKVNNKWQAQIHPEGKHIHLGYFDSELDAAKKYNEMALKYYGEFAKINNLSCGE